MLEFAALAQQCAPAVHPKTLEAIVRVESGFNPHAIGIVGAQLYRQPNTRAEAIATAQALEAAGLNFSVGLGQVNRYNLSKFGLTLQTAFDTCRNLQAASSILKECYDRARSRQLSEQEALRASFSCYYSGNFSTGFRKGRQGKPSYVAKVLGGADISVTQEKSSADKSGQLARRAVSQVLQRTTEEPIKGGSDLSSVIVYR